MNPVEDRFVLTIPKKGYRKVVKIVIQFNVNSGFEVRDFYIRACHEPVGKYGLMHFTT